MAKQKFESPPESVWDRTTLWDRKGETTGGWSSTAPDGKKPLNSVYAAERSPFDIIVADEMTLMISGSGPQVPAQQFEDGVVDTEVFDWATETLGKIAQLAEEAVAERRASLREIAAMEEKIRDSQAGTARALDRLFSGH